MVLNMAVASNQSSIYPGKASYELRVVQGLMTLQYST